MITHGTYTRRNAKVRPETAPGQAQPVLLHIRDEQEKTLTHPLVGDSAPSRSVAVGIPSSASRTRTDIHKKRGVKRVLACLLFATSLVLGFLVAAPATTASASSLPISVDDNVRTGQNFFNYTGNWVACGGCVGGSYQNSFQYSYTAGNRAVLTFTGSQVKLYGVKEPVGGIATIAVDAKPAVDVDYYAAKQTIANVYTSDVLANTRHTLTITVSGRKAVGTSPTINIDRAEIFASTTVPTPLPTTPPVVIPPTTGVGTSLDDSTTTGQNFFAYTGNWVACGGCVRGSYQNSFQYSYTAGNKAVLTFTGSQVKLYGVKEPVGGIATIAVDAKPAVDVDYYAAKQTIANVYTSDVLANTRHTLTITVSGRKAVGTSPTINIDRAEIFASTTVPTPPPTTPPVVIPPPTGVGTSLQGAITRQGTKLMLNGQQWKFAGVNADKWFGCWGAAEVPSDAQLEKYFSELNPHSLTRIWPYHGAADFAMMDRIVSAAERHNQYLAPALFDGNSTQCGTQAINKGNPQVNVDYMKAVVSRYAKGTGARATNAIAFWEASNEVGGADSVNWLQAMANGIKALDPNTLVASGSMPEYTFGSQAAYEAAHGGKMDLISIHEYDANTGMSGWAGPAATAAKALNKPWYAGEDGFCCNGGNTGSPEGNGAKVKAEWDAYLNAPEGAGMMYWALRLSAVDNTSMILSGGPFWDAARTYRSVFPGGPDRTA